MEAWLLAGLVLIVVCAIGAYYVNDTKSGIYDAKEGFAGGNPTVELKRAAQSTCENNYTACLESGTDNKSCTATYNSCNAAAQRLDTSVSATSSPGSSTTLSSATGAVAYAKKLGMTGAGDAVSWANSGDMLKAQYSTASPESKTLTQVTQNLPAPNPTAAQGDQKADSLAAYTSLENRIKPHQKPASISTPITASLASDVGTGADAGQGGGLSIRSQIRSDINKAVKEEIDDIDNEYLIKYD